MRIQLNPRVIADGDVLAGTPVIAGTEITVSSIVEQVAGGKGLEEVAQSNGMTLDDVRAALSYAA